MIDVRLSGAGSAFGWYADRRITLGGLKPNSEYQLVTEREEYPIQTNAQGAWKGQLLHDVPVCVADRGRPVLWDEGKISQADAASLLAVRQAEKERPPAEIDRKKEIPPEEPAKTITANQIPAEEEKKAQIQKEEQPEIPYRPASDGLPVDALPELQWPRQAQQIRPLFAQTTPTAVFDLPGWRTICRQEAGMPCCFGYRAKEDRVCEVLYAVRARGSLVPPKGLKGYQYMPSLDGGGYWALRQRI